MSADDDADCLEHVWRLRAVALGSGAQLEYECDRCGAITVQQGGQPFPQTI